MSKPVHAGKGRCITIPKSLGMTPTGKRVIVTDDPKTAITLPDTPMAQRFRRRGLRCGDLVELAIADENKKRRKRSES